MNPRRVPRSLFTRTLLGLATVGLMCGCANKKDAPRGPFIALERDFQAFRTWQAVDLPEHGPQGITHVAGQRREFVNKRPPPGSAAFPVGTILVKELLTEAPAGHRIFAMVKRGSDYNARGARGWEWFELRERQDGSVGIVWRGINAPKGESYGGAARGGCNGCHDMASRNDYVRSQATALGGT